MTTTLSIDFTLLIKDGLRHLSTERRNRDNWDIHGVLIAPDGTRVIQREDHIEFSDLQGQ